MSADVVKLIAETGEELDFTAVAGVELDSGYYVIMQPIQPIKGMGANEAFVFEIVRPKGVTEDRFRPVSEPEIIDEVFAQYHKMLKQ